MSSTKRVPPLSFCINTIEHPAGLATYRYTFYETRYFAIQTVSSGLLSVKQPYKFVGSALEGCMHLAFIEIASRKIPSTL